MKKHKDKEKEKEEKVLLSIPIPKEVGVSVSKKDDAYKVSLKSDKWIYSTPLTHRVKKKTKDSITGATCEASVEKVSEEVYIKSDNIFTARREVECLSQLMRSATASWKYSVSLVEPIRPLSQEEGKKPESLQIHLSNEDGRCIGFLSTPRDMESLLSYFEVKEPKQLEGKCFSSIFFDPLKALSLLGAVARSGGKYKPPPTKEVLERLAKSIASCSSLDWFQLEVDQWTREQSLAKILKHGKSWISKFADSLSQTQNASVILVAVIPHSMTFAVLLKKEMQRMDVFINPRNISTKISQARIRDFEEKPHHEERKLSKSKRRTKDPSPAHSPKSAPQSPQEHKDGEVIKRAESPRSIFFRRTQKAEETKQATRSSGKNHTKNISRSASKQSSQDPSSAPEDTDENDDMQPPSSMSLVVDSPFSRRAAHDNPIRRSSSFDNLNLTNSNRQANVSN